MKEKISRFMLAFVLFVINFAFLYYTSTYFNNPAAYIMLVFIMTIITVIMSLFILRNDLKGGCGGDCHQGRRPCNCQKNENQQNIKFYK